jgi:hypothetical protein
MPHNAGRSSAGLPLPLETIARPVLHVDDLPQLDVHDERGSHLLHLNRSTVVKGLPGSDWPNNVRERSGNELARCRSRKFQARETSNEPPRNAGRRTSLARLSRANTLLMLMAQWLQIEAALVVPIDETRMFSRIMSKSGFAIRPPCDTLRQAGSRMETCTGCNQESSHQTIT